MKRAQFSWLAALVCLIACGLPSSGQNSRLARRWRVIVVVPEQHLNRPRIPDPAVETALCRLLIDAGYKVIDQDRIRELRYSAVVDRILKGGPGAAREAMQIGRKFGADIFLTGEAFTQEVSRQRVETELGAVDRVFCRARVELKAMRVDSGERIYADSLQRTGPPDATAELASKACLEEAADAMGPQLLARLGGLAESGSQHVELEVRGVASAALARELEIALSKLAGVLDVAPGNYDARTYETELRVSRRALPQLAGKLETTPGLKRFRLKVQSASGTRIVANVR